MSGSTLVNIQNHSSSWALVSVFTGLARFEHYCFVPPSPPIFLSQDLTVVLEDPELYVDQAGLLPASFRAGIKHMCHHI